MPITNNKKTPNVADHEKRDIAAIYIEHTKGCWIRHHIENKEIELWFDGHMEMAWADQPVHHHRGEEHIDAHVATAMVAAGVALGKRLRSKEIRELLGAK